MGAVRNVSFAYGYKIIDVKGSLPALGIGVLSFGEFHEQLFEGHLLRSHLQKSNTVLGENLPVTTLKVVVFPAPFVPSSK